MTAHQVRGRKHLMPQRSTPTGRNRLMCP